MSHHYLRLYSAIKGEINFCLKLQRFYHRSTSHNLEATTGNRYDGNVNI